MATSDTVKNYNKLEIITLKYYNGYDLLFTLGEEIMAKHRAAWNCRRYHKLVNEGRGFGTGSDYKPWITIHDLASKGVVSRVLGRTTGRIHHLLSKNETAFFYILDASEKAIDIREQFPLLPVTETVEIAERLGIRHPRDPVSKYPYVMTTDFVITTPQGNVARSVKLSSELEKTRVQEKLEIERAYWEKRDIEWRIVTEKEIDYQKARNLEWVYRSWCYPQMLPDGILAGEVADSFLDLFEKTSLPITEIARETERTFGLEPGLGLTTFQYLLLQKQIPAVNLSVPLDLVSVRLELGKGGSVSWIETYV